jgi:hypothetical protein
MRSGLNNVIVGVPSLNDGSNWEDRALDSDTTLNCPFCAIGVEIVS